MVSGKFAMGAEKKGKLKGREGEREEETWSLGGRAGRRGAGTKVEPGGWCADVPAVIGTESNFGNSRGG